MKNATIKIMCMLLAVCFIAIGAMHNLTMASAGEYKKSVSKKITVNSDKEYSHTLTIDLKKKSDVTITVQATDGKSDNFFIMHGSNCGCGTMDFGSSKGKKKITVKSESKWSKGKHLLTFDSQQDYNGKTYGKKQKLKIIIKVNDAILKVVDSK